MHTKPHCMSALPRYVSDIPESQQAMALDILLRVPASYHSMWLMLLRQRLLRDSQWQPLLDWPRACWPALSAVLACEVQGKHRRQYFLRQLAYWAPRAHQSTLGTKEAHPVCLWLMHYLGWVSQVASLSADAPVEIEAMLPKPWSGVFWPDTPSHTVVFAGPLTRLLVLGLQSAELWPRADAPLEWQPDTWWISAEEEWRARAAMLADEFYQRRGAPQSEVLTGLVMPWRYWAVIQRFYFDLQQRLRCAVTTQIWPDHGESEKRWRQRVLSDRPLARWWCPTLQPAWRQGHVRCCQPLTDAQSLYHMGFQEQHCIASWWKYCQQGSVRLFWIEVDEEIRGCLALAWLPWEKCWEPVVFKAHGNRDLSHLLSTHEAIMALVQDLQDCLADYSPEALRCRSAVSDDGYIARPIMS